MSNQSPVGWYIGTYQIRFTECGQSGLDDPEQSFLVWENTVLIRADNLDHAYDKLQAIGCANEEPYENPDGQIVQWRYEGITDLVPVYEAIGDGAELMYAESKSKLKTLRQRALSKQDIYQ